MVLAVVVLAVAVGHTSQAYRIALPYLRQAFSLDAAPVDDRTVVLRALRHDAFGFVVVGGNVLLARMRNHSRLHKHVCLAVRMRRLRVPKTPLCLCVHVSMSASMSASLSLRDISRLRRSELVGFESRRPTRRLKAQRRQPQRHQPRCHLRSQWGRRSQTRHDDQVLGLHDLLSLHTCTPLEPVPVYSARLVERR